MLITKQDGRQEPFNPLKLHRSLKRVGCSENTCAQVVDEIQSELHEGDSTSAIYKRAFELLRKKELPLAARYSMKRAILDLGPSGFPFEDFVAEIFKAQGFEVATDKYVAGICAPHEVDVYASKEGKCIGAELKFHNRLGFKTDLKVALYVHSRFQDIRKAHPKGRVEGGVDEGWLITNTAFTKNAMRYGECVGLRMVSWEYPEKGSLQDMIEEVSVQPVTALTTLSKQDKRLLLDQKLVLCRMLHKETKQLSGIGLSTSKIDDVLAEANMLCGH